ncbi:hypothetical protein P4361_08425 [Fictibacillus sp. B-59209]|uniref:hypothetical protein n=1 Tax=Fictibacillus sp. B-59209 TaxID=3024873 RepID=UPI002E1C3590|nr:hypothetical protein [Fictibacillus sp. B-59209]
MTWIRCCSILPVQALLHVKGCSRWKACSLPYPILGGIEAVIVGVKPEHAKQMNALNADEEFSFLSTLQEAMKKHL